ncbi:heparan-alpha-glucosaminide N-acetyltransferase domain-containing protein [uncultured Pseudokineococcus sp.]|uniref:heparan-alpha-glucosaminide N-acetyltransferase domain-containing protein n=1 Tax=uncultured Pseudokineococcus sp. TaxID=1642928 RepID=UPI0026028E84|nr:heparan-alpha-glucosaminide N-acetyltransferase domain-containing protein [uncultured Pseudokineococcus sp.]
MTAPSAPPSRGARLRGPSRLVGVDAARGLALLGMVATHVLSLETYDADGFSTGPSATALVAAGRASALFAVLAGVSLALANGGLRAPAGADLARARRGVAARAGVVALVGLLVGSFGAPVAVILVNYALLFLAVLPVLGWGPRRLVPLGAAWLLVVPVLLHPLRDALVGSGALPLSPGSSPSFVSLAEPGLLLGHLLLTGYYPVLSWAGFVLLGLGVGRLDLRRSATAGAVALAGLAAALGAWAVSAALRPLAMPSLDVPLGFPLSGEDLATSLETGLYGTTPTTSWWWLAVDAPHSGTPPDMVGVAGSALAVLGVALLVARVARPVVWPFAAMGSMTLTLYSLHVFSLAVIALYEYGGGAAPPEGPLYAAQVVGLLLVGGLWQLTGLRGPLEGLVASASRAARGPAR